MTATAWQVGTTPTTEGLYAVRMKGGHEGWAHFRFGRYGPMWQCTGKAGRGLFTFRAPIVAWRGPIEAPTHLPEGVA